MPTDKRQRQKEGRAVRAQAARKVAIRRDNIRRAKRIGFIFGTAALILLIVGIVQRSNKGDLPPRYEAFRQQATACDGTTPEPEVLKTFDAAEPQSDISGESTVTARLVTSCGDILIDLDPAASPKTVESFVFLARSGYYDGTAFHRLSKGFVIQGGDPQADGLGGPGYVVPDEFPPADFAYTEGVVAMANNGRSTTGSQFFIVTRADAKLAPTYNVLGRVRDSQDTLDLIAAIPLAGEVPRESLYVEEVEIEITS